MKEHTLQLHVLCVFKIRSQPIH